MHHITPRWDELLALANLYPSPHNGQPIRLRITDDATAEVVFVRERGLQATDISYIFSFVSMGVFVEHFTLTAKALGHEVAFELSLPREQDLKGHDPIQFASMHISWDTTARNKKVEDTLRFRQTSRKKYFEGLAAEVTAQLATVAHDHNMKMVHLTAPQATQAIWLNQRAVFDDLFDNDVRRELDHWLRYSPEQKQTTQDGLAYDCMEINGQLMHFMVRHPWVLRLPGLSKLLRQYYLRTMTDHSDVFYMMAPFGNETASFVVGRVIMQLWYVIAEQGYYLHPFGTIMSNHQAHQDFLQLAGEVHESRTGNYLVFIFRAGKSKTPARSLRLPYHAHLLME